jgi:N-methylhydantoinase B
MTNTLNTPVEAIEHDYPFRIKRYHIRSQSGGTGEFRGGHGIIRNFEFLDTASVSILSDRRKFTPYGLRSGKKGQAGKNILFSKGKKHNLPSKTTVNVKKGDIISICTPGGGGYGRR